MGQTGWQVGCCIVFSGQEMLGIIETDGKEERVLAEASVRNIILRD
jgi:hypothetical protein